jgi:hypothetical protein
MTTLIDGNDFYNGFGRTTLDPSDYEVITKGVWKGPKDEHIEAARLAGIKRSWANADDRRKATSQRLSALRRSGHVQHVYTPEQRAKKTAICRRIAQSRQKPCTVDGITIYPGQRALIKALGGGKAGSRHPNFRYVEVTQ